MTVGEVFRACTLYASVFAGHSTYTVAVLITVVTGTFGSAIAELERRRAIKAIPEVVHISAYIENLVQSCC
jgi:hypothetical protein